MSKLNKKVSEGTKILSGPDVTLNEEGGIAFKPNAEMELVLRVVSSLISENGFYKTGGELDADLRSSIETVLQTNPAFILKLAYKARKDWYLRTAPVVLMAEYALSKHKGVMNSRKYIAETIQRADEITELLAYIMTKNRNKDLKGKVPQVIKYGIADAFNKFDAYRISKYNRDGEVTLRDAMFLTHPKPKNEEQAAVFKALADQKLAPPETWEVAISVGGSTKENWEAIAPKMPYMASLRNLRTFVEKGVNMKPILKRIADPQAVAKSKQFPYRFLSAYKELECVQNSGKTLEALSDAVELSVQNVPTFTGKTFVTCDISGSMDSSMSAKSKMTKAEVGCLFGAIMHKKSEDAITSVFATDHVPVSLNSRDSMFTNMRKLMGQDTNGCGTNAYKVMDWLIAKRVFVDRIVLFSDMQCYSTSTGWRGVNSEENIYAGLQKYRNQVNKDVFVYSFDLASYGTTQFPQDDQKVCLAGGFSDKVLSFIPMFERSRAGIIEEVESVSL